MELLPVTYTFKMTYAYTSNQVSQDVGSSPTVTFQTGKVTSTSGDVIQYHSGGWRTFSNGMEMLPGTYTFKKSDSSVFSATIATGPNTIA